MNPPIDSKNTKESKPSHQLAGGLLLSKRVQAWGYLCIQPLAQFFVSYRIHPNHLSWLSFISGLLSGLSVAYGYFGFAGILFGFAGLFDMLDGLVARLSNQTSEAGHVLDTSLDRYVEFFFLGGVAVYYRSILPLMVLALFAMLGSFMVSYLTMVARAKNAPPEFGQPLMRRPERMLVLGFGAIVASLLAPVLETTHSDGVKIAHPMIFSLIAVGVLSNYSAFRELFRLKNALKVAPAELRL